MCTTQISNDEWIIQQQIICSNPVGTMVILDREGIFSDQLYFKLLTDNLTGKRYLQALLSKTDKQILVLLRNHEVLVVFKQTNQVQSLQSPNDLFSIRDTGSVYCYGKPKIIEENSITEQLIHIDISQNVQNTQPAHFGIVSMTPETPTFPQDSIVLQIDISKIESKPKFERRDIKVDIPDTLNNLNI